MIQHLHSRNRIVITVTLLLISGLSFGDNDERSSSAHRDTHTHVLEEIVEEIKLESNNPLSN